MCTPHASSRRLLVVLLLVLGTGNLLQAIDITSPDDEVRVTIDVDGGQLRWTVQRSGVAVLLPAAIGPQVAGTDLGDGVTLGSASTGVVDVSYPDPHGVKTTARDHHRWASIPVTHSASGTTWSVEVRVFDDGAAIRYRVPGSGSRTIGNTDTRFALPETRDGTATRVWWMNRSDGGWAYTISSGAYQETIAANLVSDSNTGARHGAPLLARVHDAAWVLLSEAAVYDHPGSHFVALGNGILRTNSADSSFSVTGEYTSPWRVCLATPDLDRLVNSDLISALNPAADPVLFADTTWIRHGRSAWTWWSRTNSGADMVHLIAAVDEAQSMGIEFLTVDDPWETRAGFRTYDGVTYPDQWAALDFLVGYAQARNVGIFVWKDKAQIASQANREAWLNQVAAAGAVGIKVDFFNNETLSETRLQEAILRDAAERQLMVNFHGISKANGWIRRYPNEVTREGIFGLEQIKWRTLPVTNNAALPFTRAVVGPGDYTPLAFRSSYNGRFDGASWAHELAVAVTVTSPLLTVAADYTDLAALPGLARTVVAGLPSTWDETRVLSISDPGSLVAMARRSGSTWYLALMNGSNSSGRTLNDLALSFLGPGSYDAVLLADHPGSQSGFADGGTTTSGFTASATLNVSMRASGGFVARFTPSGGGSTAPTITSQPTSQTIDSGTSASLSVAASGDPSPTYQWQQRPSGGSWATISGATSTSYTTPSLAHADSGIQYRVVASNSAGSVTSAAATITVSALAPTITSQPTSQTIDSGTSASLSVEASGDPSPTYQWQQRPSGGSWATISGATSTSYTSPSLAHADSGIQYRVVASNSAGSVTSAAATITVGEDVVAPIITGVSPGGIAPPGELITVSVTASGTGPLTYAWYWSGFDSATWTPIPDSDTASLTLPMNSIGDDPYISFFRVVVSNSAGSAETSVTDGNLIRWDAAEAPYVITPISATTITQPLGGSSILSARAGANWFPVTIRWQRQDAGTTDWVTVSTSTLDESTGAASGIGDLTYAIPALTYADDGAVYRLMLENELGSTVSPTWTVTVVTRVISVRVNQDGVWQAVLVAIDPAPLTGSATEVTGDTGATFVVDPATEYRLELGPGGGDG